MILDSETRLDSTIGLAGKFTYNYSLINYTYDELDIDHFNSIMEPKLHNNYCTSDDMKQFLNKDVAVSFAYFAKEGKQVVKYSYKPADCKG